MKNSPLVYSIVLCTCFCSLVLAQTTTRTDLSNASSVSGINGTSVGKGQTISSAYNPKDFQWDIEWPGRLSQYDLVYKSPPIDPMQGIPLGNGDVASLLWCEDSKIIIVVNKCDLWDDAKPDKTNNWKNEKNDYSTTQRHALRIIIDFKFPVFNTLYLSDFNARLNLANASLTLEAASPFGKVSLNSFIDHKSGIIFFELGSGFNEDVPLQISVERFGSRTYSSWYSAINRDASIGLSGTDAIADDKNVYITQKLSGGTFAVGGSVIQNNGLAVKYSREHSRCASIQLSGNRQKSTLLAFCVTSPVNSDPVTEVKNTLSFVREKGIESFRQSHSEAWKSIWTRSFMDYGDDYLNNLWHLTMYYANASQGGKYPGRFNNGLWGWSRDVQQWNFYFHWNQQQLNWPLNAAGFHELIAPYLDFRFNSLPQAKKDAKETLNTDGAFISDVTNRNGYNAMGIAENHTPVAEIALDFWRQYRYTGDKIFLKEKALPFLIEATRFFESLLIKETDGLYHAKESTGYEGWIKLKDGLTDLVYAKALFTTVLEGLKIASVDIPEAKRWLDILGKMAPLPEVMASKGLILKDAAEYKINWGIFKGSSVKTDEIAAAGWGIKEKKWLTTYFEKDDPEYSYFSKDDPAYSPLSVRNELKLLDGIFPSVPSAPVFPSGLIGLAQKESSMFDVMTATTLLYGTECTGWDPVSIVLARLGLTKELAIDLEHFPGRWQIYCNGWGHWGMEGLINQDAELFFRTNMVRDIASPKAEKFPLPMWPFRHMSMESMSILATAINESLFQSYDGVLRIAPAFPVNRTGRFTLHAVGGFVVSSEIKSGEVQWICIKSLSGNPCKLVLPWGKAIIQSNLTKKNKVVNGNIVEIKTKADEVIMILPEGQDLRSWSVISEKPSANEKVRYHSSGKTQLGIPRMF
jgi:alpha-L-fucosidase 2